MRQLLLICLCAFLSSALAAETLVVSEQLGVNYDHVLLDAGAKSVPVLQANGTLYGVQSVPAMPFDPADLSSVKLTTISLAPNQLIELTPAPAEAAAPTTITTADGIITNGRFALRLPAAGIYNPPFPGPIASLKIGDGPWFGASTLLDVPLPGRVSVDIESLGPACVQWRVSYRWGNAGGVDCRYRWASGSDTILVTERGLADSDAAIEWLPFDATPAKAYWWGGGEAAAPMRLLTPPVEPNTAPQVPGRRLLRHLGHISYFNNWNAAWVGFAADDERFVGVFAGWGSRWQQRGNIRFQAMEDGLRGAYLRFPVKAGQRLYGIVLGDKATSGITALRPNTTCLLNRRKVQWSDFAINKVRDWNLDPPLEEKIPHLVTAQDLAGFRARLQADPEVTEMLARFVQQPDNRKEQLYAAALWKGDEALQRKCCEQMLAGITEYNKMLAVGGYELTHFIPGRMLRNNAYELDLLWAQNLLTEAQYRQARKWCLLLAYIFSDPDQWEPTDFWPVDAPGSGVAAAMGEEISTTPAPPNFAQEWLRGVGIVAELFPNHPRHLAWRQWAMKMNDKYLNTFYAPDGTYCEGINYSTVVHWGLVSYAYPLYIHKVKDYFADPRVKGAFRQILDMQMPPLADHIQDLKLLWDANRCTYAGWQMPRRSPIAADGNSGSAAIEPDLVGMLQVGAAVYQKSDPRLAGQLMTGWRAGGKPVFDLNPVLSVLTLDPRITSTPPAEESVWRHSHSVISRAKTADGEQVWCLFRAGSATHHLDFDQANLHLAAFGSVLLGDYGYGARDQQNKPVPVFSTWTHNTVVYSDWKETTSGYTGLEQAPEPANVYLGKGFDWVVHRLVNTHMRDFSNNYTPLQIPVARTIHLRHYLFMKPDYFVIWDTFEEAHGPSTFWLHPTSPMQDLGNGLYQSGDAGKPHLTIQFLLPQTPQVVENQQYGPLWSFGVRNDSGQPYLAIIAPQREDRHIRATFDAKTRTLSVCGDNINDAIVLPDAADTRMLPKVTRN